MRCAFPRCSIRHSIVDTIPVRGDTFGRTVGLRLFLWCEPSISLEIWWITTDSNRQPPECKSGALPVELATHECGDSRYVRKLESLTDLMLRSATGVKSERKHKTTSDKATRLHFNKAVNLYPKKFWKSTSLTMLGVVSGFGTTEGSELLSLAMRAFNSAFSF